MKMGENKLKNSYNMTTSYNIKVTTTTIFISDFYNCDFLSKNYHVMHYQVDFITNSLYPNLKKILQFQNFHAITYQHPSVMCRLVVITGTPLYVTQVIFFSLTYRKQDFRRLPKNIFNTISTKIVVLDCQSHGLMFLLFNKSFIFFITGTVLKKSFVKIKTSNMNMSIIRN